MPQEERGSGLRFRDCTRERVWLTTLLAAHGTIHHPPTLLLTAPYTMRPEHYRELLESRCTKAEGEEKERRIL